MSDRFTIDGIDGDLRLINTGGQAFVEVLGETHGGQRRRVHFEVTIENVREIGNVAQAFLTEIDPPDREKPEDPFGPVRRLRGV